MSLQDDLRKLFLLDQQVRGLRGRLDGAQARSKVQQNRLDQLVRQRQELVDQLKHAQTQASSLEHEAGDIEQRIDQLRIKMNSVKNNKEYSALLIEVSTFKNDKAKLETQALEHLGRVDQLQLEINQLNQRVTDQRKLLGVSQAEVDGARGEVGQQLDELSSQRDAAEKLIPAETLSVFNRLIYVHEGEAMASVIEEDRRHMEYCCGGCHLGLPIENVSALMRQNDNITICPSCGRILYFEPELKSRMSSR